MMKTNSFSHDALLFLQACGLATGILSIMFLGLGVTTYSAEWLQSHLIRPAYGEQISALDLVDEHGVERCKKTGIFRASASLF